MAPPPRARRQPTGTGGYWRALGNGVAGESGGNYLGPFQPVGDGRRWFIPAPFVEAARSIVLGGSKYSEFEVEGGTPVEALIYGDAPANRIPNASPLPGECQSGQMDLTVNQAAMPTQVRILPPPSGCSRQVLLRPKRQKTIPKAPCEDAGLNAGDRLRVCAEGPGRSCSSGSVPKKMKPGQRRCPSSPPKLPAALSSAR